MVIKTFPNNLSQKYRNQSQINVWCKHGLNTVSGLDARARVLQETEFIYMHFS